MEFLGDRQSIDHVDAAIERQNGFLDSIGHCFWAMTVAANARSRGLMERFAMARYPHMDFEHPAFPPGHELRPHIIYGIG
jgi:RimJ/RimL family protein N-acetyltransferase